ncbi:MAG: hypothetical protein JO072_01585, partial [Parafilimonas sp.]|nr:hypothetical protein [Parafilimonas sp.]
MIKTKATVLFLFSLFIITSCKNKPAENNTAAKKTYISKNTDSFNMAFDSVLINYDSLRNAFINWDTMAANKYAELLQMAFISVPYEQLKDEDAATKASSIAN